MLMFSETSRYLFYFCLLSSNLQPQPGCTFDIWMFSQASKISVSIWRNTINNCISITACRAVSNSETQTCLWRFWSAIYFCIVINSFDHTADIQHSLHDNGHIYDKTLTNTAKMFVYHNKNWGLSFCMSSARKRNDCPTMVKQTLPLSLVLSKYHESEEEKTTLGYKCWFIR